MEVSVKAVLFSRAAFTREKREILYLAEMFHYIRYVKPVYQYRYSLYSLHLDLKVCSIAVIVA